MDDLIEVIVGNQFGVFMTKAVAKRFQKLEADRRARCLKWMEYYANDGHDYLDDTKLKHEGRFSTGGKSGTKVPIWAFKARQLRVYGSPLSDGRFICTEIDDSKKQDAADQSLLHAAARKLSEYL